MSRANVRAAVRTHLETNWTTTPLVYQNTLTEPPLSTAGNLQPWVYVEISFNGTDQWSIGEEDRTDNRWREDGLVFFHLFTPAGAGVEVSDQYADAMVELFRGVQLSPDIEFRDFTSDIGGPGDDDGNYYRVTVAVEWVRN